MGIASVLRMKKLLWAKKIAKERVVFEDSGRRDPPLGSAKVVIFWDYSGAYKIPIRGLPDGFYIHVGTEPSQGICEGPQAGISGWI